MREYGYEEEPGRRYRGEGYYGGYYGYYDPRREGERGEWSRRRGEDRGYRGEERRGEERGYRGEERGFFDRAGDEVRSWFGDEEAERRRRRDEREGGWGHGRGRGESDRWDDREWARQWGYMEGRGERGVRGPGERSGGGASAGRYGGAEYGGEPGYGAWGFGRRSSGMDRDWGERSGEGWTEGFGPWPGGRGLGTEGWRDRERFGQMFGRGPRGWQRSDERIREELCERLARHGDLDASSMEVQVQNGEVTLSGEVQNRQDKRLAEDLAEQVFGVKEVHNRLRVQQGLFGGESQGQQPSQQQTGGWGTRAA